MHRRIAKIENDLVTDNRFGQVRVGVLKTGRPNTLYPSLNAKPSYLKHTDKKLNGGSRPSNDCTRRMGKDLTLNPGATVALKRLRPVLTSLLVFILLYGFFWVLSTMVVFQVTGSMPIGLYLKKPIVNIQSGQLILFDLPENVKEMVKSRRWAPRQVTMLMKEVVGMPGDEIQIKENRVYINKVYFGPVKKKDRQGLPLPSINKTFILGKDEFFSASRKENSFDSRYFGPVHLQDIKAVVEPIFTFDQ
jgi:conjugative transfer signal peptidase TraF